MNRFVSFAFALICTGCAPLSAGQQYFGQATPLCRIVMNEQTYAGRRVLVTALLVHTLHTRELYSPECERSAVLVSSSDTWDHRAKRVIDAALANNKLANIPVVVTGIFHPWTRYENGVPVIQVGGPTVEDAKVVAARQP